MNSERKIMHKSHGKVYLVGAGPGDPKLITVRGAEILSKADVVVNDRLANPRLLEYINPNAEIIYAGKQSRNHFLPQDEIIKVIIDHAMQGKVVVRLKGGDPFVFGRGGEEAEALTEAGIKFEVVPGITSAIAVPAYAGIPVTSRTYAASFGVITGHEAPGKSSTDIKWDKISTGLDTIVFLMGIENLENIVKNLVANGRSVDTPVAVIQWGTYAKQRTVVGTLSDIVDKCSEAGITAPAITIVGNVVKLRETVSWFEKKPLFGKRIIVTRAENQASALVESLENFGADVIEIPVIKFIAPNDYSSIDDAIDNLGRFNWILFTSANGVEWFVKRLMECGKDIRAMANAKLAAIGPRTAAAMEKLKLKVDFIPSKYIAESVVEEYPEDISGKSILIPQAKEARDELPKGLQAKGAEVCIACAYETVADISHAEELRGVLNDGEIDIITFTSASTVRNFMALIDDITLPENITIACIGPITADEARVHGLNPSIIADEYTIDGLVESILLGNKTND